MLARSILFSLAVVGATATAAHAQRLKAPEVSPQATVQQTVGLTDITVNYHRPAINGRKVWGELVPYDAVWRAGANENTTITISSDVKVQGKQLKAGTYGLHMIPTKSTWTIIFSNANTSWGSYTYDQKEDAVRVVVTPKEVPISVERLQYRFDDIAEKQTTLVLAWEKLVVPVTIDVDTPKVVMESMKKELRGGIGFTWQGWNQAARYYATNGGSLDEALGMADKSIDMNPSYANLQTRALILDKQNKKPQAAETRAKALTLANEADLNQVGYQLMNEKKMDEAIAMFTSITQKYPESWNAQDSLAEALATKGDKAGAIAAYGKALAMVKDPVQKKRIEGTLATLKK
jgi:TolA-binding protein